MNHSQKSESPGRKAWLKFRKNKLSISGLVIIFIAILIALLGPILRPDSTQNANDQNLIIAKQKPGFEVTMLLISRGETTRDRLGEYFEGGFPNEFKEIPIQSYQWNGYNLEVELFSKSGKGEIQTFSFGDIASWLVLKNQPFEDTMKEVERDFIVNKKYLLGTDKFGRDLLSRLMAGTTISLAVGIIAVLISLLIGLTLGAISGYYGGKVDDAIMWIINVVWSIPTLLMVIAITFAFGKGFWKVFLAVGLTMWVEVARVVRGQFLSLREKEFVEAGKVLGFSDMRIIFRHILPNALGPVIVIAAANFAAAILIEAGLSFLGIGAQIPTPSWGNMIKEHYSLITTDLAYLAILPGVCIMILVLAFMMVGNGLRDAFDVKA